MASDEIKAKAAEYFNPEQGRAFLAGCEYALKELEQREREAVRTFVVFQSWDKRKSEMIKDGKETPIDILIEQFMEVWKRKTESKEIDDYLKQRKES
jgi:hypothetical protein